MDDTQEKAPHGAGLWGWRAMLDSEKAFIVNFIAWGFSCFSVEVSLAACLMSHT